MSAATESSPLTVVVRTTRIYAFKHLTMFQMVLGRRCIVRSMRWAAAGSMLVAALAIGACAPSTAQPSETGDEKTGTLRVWLFDEAGRAPKEALVNQAVAEFTAAHQGVAVEVS